MVVISEKDRIDIKGKSILLIQLGAIGDVVVTMPVVRALRERFPSSKLVVAVRAASQELIEDCPWADAVIAVDKKSRRWRDEIAYQLRFLRSVRAHGFDLAVDARAGTRGAILSLLSGAPCRVGFAYRQEWANRMFTHVVAPLEWEGLYAAEQNLKIIAPLGLQVSDRIPRLEIPDSRRRSAAEILRREGVALGRFLLAVHPRSVDPNRDWGIHQFARLVDRMGTSYRLPILLTGSSDDRVYIQELIDRCGVEVVNLAGKTSVGELAAVLEACRLVIGVDTAAIHIAAAVGTPTISIFGPTDPRTWKPRGVQHEAVHRSMACAPCGLGGCKTDGKRSCLVDLSVDEVWKTVRKRIEEIQNLGQAGFPA